MGQGFGAFGREAGCIREKKATRRKRPVLLDFLEQNMQFGLFLLYIIFKNFLYEHMFVCCA